ncbi:MAG: GpE family phage tail protein [Caulobacteraceae bacterium]
MLHFPPSELWEMDFEELTMWHDQARRLCDEGLKT